jgi:hypothetical protein
MHVEDLPLHNLKNRRGLEAPTIHEAMRRVMGFINRAGRDRAGALSTDKGYSAYVFLERTVRSITASDISVYHAGAAQFVNEVP